MKVLLEFAESGTVTPEIGSANPPTPPTPCDGVLICTRGTKPCFIAIGMHSCPNISTPRLFLRAWREQDLAPFAAMNADPRVMEFLPKMLNRQESDAAAARSEDHFAKHGFGKWAVEILGGASFIGYVGLAVAEFDAPFTPCVEIGWRLAFEHWGRGYATEAARAVLDFAFAQPALDEVVSFTVPNNLRSRRVMERLG